jgi:hypothetical protein
VAAVTKKLTPAWYADFALKWARQGDPGHLIARLMLALQGRAHLSDGEYWFIVEALEATASKQTNAQLRDLERRLIAQQFDGLVDEEGMEPEDAMKAVMKSRDCRERKIRYALKHYGKPRRFR